MCSRYYKLTIIAPSLHNGQLGPTSCSSQSRTENRLKGRKGEGVGKEKEEEEGVKEGKKEERVEPGWENDKLEREELR